MKEDHYEIQTPKSNCKIRSINAHSKKINHHQQQKSINKNLSSVFTPITENDVVLENNSISESVDVAQLSVEIGKTSLNSDGDLLSDNAVAIQHPEDSVKAYSVSEAFVFADVQTGESVESCNASLTPYASPSSVTARSLEMTPLSSITTVEMTPSSSQITADEAAVFVASITRDGATTEEMNSYKIESLVKHLRESMCQVLHSADLDPKYKKLLDALVKMVIQEFYSTHDNRSMVVELFSRKGKFVLLSFVFAILAVSAGIFLFSDAQSSYHGPPPT